MFAMCAGTLLCQLPSSGQRSFSILHVIANGQMLRMFWRIPGSVGQEDILAPSRSSRGGGSCLVKAMIPKVPIVSSQTPVYDTRNHIVNIIGNLPRLTSTHSTITQPSFSFKDISFTLGPSLVSAHRIFCRVDYASKLLHKFVQS